VRIGAPHQPANPMWVSRLLSYAFFVFVAIPLSIHVDGRTASSAAANPSRRRGATGRRRRGDEEAQPVPDAAA